jgi:hypothetical protein
LCQSLADQSAMVVTLRPPHCEQRSLNRHVVGKTGSVDLRIMAAADPLALGSCDWNGFEDRMDDQSAGRASVARMAARRCGNTGHRIAA